MTLKHVLKHFSKTEVQEDERFSLAPMREREELLCERSELSNSGEGYISCAEHTVKDFLPFTTHFSQLCTPHPSYGHPLPREGKKTSCAKRTEKNLFSYSPIHLFTFKKAAFTLAEVLITLAIIGVVAAMTLPTLIQNHQKQAYVTGLKKGINTIQNAFNQMKAEEGVTNLIDTELFTKGVCQGPSEEYCRGDISHTGSDAEYLNYSEVEQILPKYLKVVKTYKPGEYTTNYKAATFYSTEGYKLSPSADNSLNNDPRYGISKGVAFYTADGMIFYITTGSYKGIDIFIDVNGNKGPNQQGRDLFKISMSVEGDEKFNYDVGFSGIVMKNGWKMDY